MERHEVLAMMTTLKLAGMRAAYDDILADGLKRRHPVQQIFGALLRAEIADKTARSIKYQMASARLPAARELAEFDFAASPVNEPLTGRIQPTEPGDGRPRTPTQATPPIETVAMPTERSLARDPPAVAPAPAVDKPSAPTEEQVAWDTYSALRQDWSRHLAAAERAGVHAIYVRGYKQLRARMEALAENPALEDRPRRSLGNVLAQLGKGTETRREIEERLMPLLPVTPDVDRASTFPARFLDRAGRCAGAFGLGEVGFECCQAG